MVDDLGEPQEILTSLDQLAAATCQDAEGVRIALAELVRSGDAAYSAAGSRPTRNAWRHTSASAVS